MNRHLIHGLIVGGIFAVFIVWIAASDAYAAGGFALLASIVFGLAAGLCIGGLIAANFAMLAIEQTEKQHAPARQPVEAHANA